MVLLLAAIPIALLPATARDVPAAAVSEAQEALGRSLPAPFEAAKLDLASVREHLAAAGASCRAAPICVCAAVPFEAGARVIDLEVARLSARAWTADVKLLLPCEDEIIDRKAAVVEASAPALSRFVSEAAVAMLRGRDLGQLRYTAVARELAPAVARPESYSPPVVAAPAIAPAVAGPAVAAPGAVLPEVSEAYQRGLAFIERGDYSAADQALTHALDLAPANAPARAARGKARLGLSQVYPALNDFRRANQLDPGLSFPVYGLAEVHRRLGDRAAAIRFFQAYLGMTAAPDSSADLRKAATLWLEALRKSD